MISSRIGLAVVGGACVVAAGTGAFIATRQADGPAPAAAVSAPATSPSASPVQETEAVVEDAAPAPDGPSTAVAAVKEGPRQPHLDAPVAPPVPAPRPSPGVASRREPATRPEARQARTQVPSEPAGRTQAEPASEAARRSAPIDTGRTDPAPGAADARTRAPMTEPVDPIPAPDTTSSRSDPVDTARQAEPRLEELVVPGDSVIGLQLESTVSSESARVEDRVDARVTRDVMVGGRVAVPAGTRVRGAVTVVDRGGKMRDRARLGVRFHTLVLADGTTMPIQTETVFREGESPASASSAKIGGAAIGGALLGAILGGGKGAAIGGATGAAGGTAAVMAGSRRAATLNAGSTMTVRVLSPISVTVERE